MLLKIGAIVLIFYIIAVVYLSSRMYEGMSTTDSREVLADNKNMSVASNLIASFIENSSDELNEVLTSEPVYFKVKKLMEKLVNRCSGDKKYTSTNIENVTTYDNPDMFSYNNANPTDMTTLIRNPILVTNQNVSELPLSHEYMKAEGGPMRYDSLWAYAS